MLSSVMLEKFLNDPISPRDVRKYRLDYDKQTKIDINHWSNCFNYYESNQFK